MMTNTTIESDLIIKSINNEIRRNILRLLMGEKMSYTEIAHLLNFNLKKESGKFNFHLKQLSDVELITNKDELYQLTPKGEEIYYLLLDIERDREIDPHGMLTALIRLEGKREFWFFVSSVAIIISLQALMIGLVALLALGTDLILQIYGITLIVSSLVLGIRSLSYYISTATELLGKRSTLSKTFSTLFFISIQWYLIRTKHRALYFLTSLVTMMGISFSLLASLLHLAEGVESTGNFLYVLDAIAVTALVLGSLMLQRLYQSAATKQTAERSD